MSQIVHHGRVVRTQSTRRYIMVGAYIEGEKVSLKIHGYTSSFETGRKRTDGLRRKMPSQDVRLFDRFTGKAVYPVGQVFKPSGRVLPPGVPRHTQCPTCGWGKGFTFAEIHDHITEEHS